MEATASRSLYKALVFASRHLTALVERELAARANVSMPDFEILMALSSAPDSSARSGELALMLNWEKSRISHQVARMEKRGLVCRRACKADHRGTWVSITDQGRAALAEAVPALEDALEQAIGPIATSSAGANFTDTARVIGEKVVPNECREAFQEA